MGQARGSALEGLVCALYRAVDQPDAWVEITHQISAALNTDKFLIATRDKVSLDYQGYCHWSMGDDALKAYLSHYMSVDVLSQSLARQPRNKFHTSQALYPDKDFVSSELYNDYCRVHDIRHSAGVTFDVPDSTLYTQFGFLRGAEMGEFTEQDIQPWNALVPHFKQFVYLKHKFRSLELQARSTEQIVEHFSVATFLCKANGQVLYRNDLAESMLRTSKIFTSRFETVSFNHQKHRERFSKLLHQAQSAADGKGSFSSGAMRVEDDGAALEMRVLPFTFRPDGERDASQPCALVLVMDADCKQFISPTTLRQLYDLTIAEAEIAILMAQGVLPKEVAEKRQASLLTVRTQIRSINQKMGTNSHAMLATKILTGMGRN